MEIEITESELIQALEEALTASEEDGGWVTVRELVDMCGWSTNRVLEGLRELKAAERLESRYVVRLDLCNRRARVPGYRLRV